jgi:hypothetical protein
MDLSIKGISKMICLMVLEGNNLMMDPFLLDSLFKGYLMVKGSSNGLMAVNTKVNGRITK